MWFLTKFRIGDTIHTNTGHNARVITLTELFGQQYADVFIEPSGPVQRLPVSALRPLDDPLTILAGVTPGAGQVDQAPLFVVRLAAYQLQALLTQQGVLSAANFRLTPLPH